MADEKGTGQKRFSKPDSELTAREMTEADLAANRKKTARLRQLRLENEGGGESAKPDKPAAKLIRERAAKKKRK